MVKWLLLFVGASVCLSLLAAQTPQAASQSNPFFEEWKTPFGVPPFERIKEEHFVPAIKEGIVQQRREVNEIANSRKKATFANTVERLDASGELLDKVQAVFSNLSGAETNDQLQAIAREVSPLMSALRDDILLNEKLFARISTVWQQRNRSKLSAEQLRLVEETHKQFVRGGANLPAEKKQRLRKINEELSLLSLKFGENILKETNAYRLVIDKKEDLDGLPPNVIAAAADAAKAAKLEGKWVFTLQAPSIWPFLTYSKNRELREQILTAYAKRGDNGNERDNKEVLVKIATLRAERAKIMSAPNHASFVLEERMAKTPDQVYGLLNKLWSPALVVAKKEAADLQAMIKQEGGDFQLRASDWRYYAEKVKKARFDLDDSELRPHFKLDNVRDGAFYVANKLYGLTFIERTDIPKYHAEVKTFEVKDKDGSHLGVFLADYHPRPGKRAGAWSSGYRSQRFKGGKDIRPIVVNVCNFTRPTADAPALLTLEETETLFHEFGHGLHSLLRRIHYGGLGGVPRDFVELPSQIMENWATAPEVMKVYAKHYKTGEPIPDSLIAKIQKAEKFNQGFATVEYLAASLLDMDWHMLSEGVTVQATEFENQSLEKMGLLPEIIVRYRSPYFAHIFSGGYSAGYYSYIWSEVLDSDAFGAFKERGLFDPATALSFRQNILEKGGTMEAMDMYKRFRGREPSVEFLLEKRGLNLSIN